MKTAEYQIPAAPAGWFLSEYPSVGALVVPLGNTEADLVGALARGWRPLLVTKANTRTGRATARTSEHEARPVVYSGRGGGGWRQGGRWVWFATPRTPILPPAAPDTTVWDAYRAEQAAETADVRPVWLYGAAAGTEGEPTPESAELADDAPDTTPRPALSVYVLASRAAGAALDRHSASACPACAAEAEGRGWCAVWTKLARRSSDAADVLRGALAVSR